MPWFSSVLHTPSTFATEKTSWHVQVQSVTKWFVTTESVETILHVAVLQKELLFCLRNATRLSATKLKTIVGLCLQNMRDPAHQTRVIPAVVFFNRTKISFVATCERKEQANKIWQGFFLNQNDLDAWLLVDYGRTGSVNQTGCGNLRVLLQPSWANWYMLLINTAREHLFLDPAQIIRQ